MRDRNGTITDTRYTITTTGVNNLADLIGMIGPEAVAAALPPLTDEGVASLNAFGARVRSMSDDEIRTAWGITDPELIGMIREQFSTDLR